MPCFGDDHQLCNVLYMYKGERNVKFMCHIIKRDNPSSPSLYDVKRFALPGYAAPSLVCVSIQCVCMLFHHTIINFKQTANYL